MAGVIAVMNSKRNADGEPLVGFANPLLYSIGSQGNGVEFTTAPINQIIAPREPVSVLRGYASELTGCGWSRSIRCRSTSRPDPTRYSFAGSGFVKGSTSNTTGPRCPRQACLPTPAGYNDVTGLGVPWVPKLINQE